MTLLKEDLLEFSNWKPPAKRYLSTRFQDNIDILPILSQYKDHITDFHIWFMSCLKALHEGELAQYERILTETESLRPEDIRLEMPKPR